MTDKPDTDRDAQPDDHDPEIADLREQVSQQQQQIKQLEATVKKMLPTRRQALKTGAGGLLAGGLFTAGQATAEPGDDGDTVWGSDTNRDDYYADEINANTVNTGEIDSSNGYAWQSVEGNRSESTWYQAPANEDIWVSVVAVARTDNINMRVQLDINTNQSANPVLEEQKASATRFDKINLVGRIPAGRDYQLRFRENSADVALDSWTELR